MRELNPHLVKTGYKFSYLLNDNVNKQVEFFHRTNGEFCI